MTGKNEIREILKDVDAGEILYDEPMSLHTSLAVGGKTDALITINNENQLERVVKRLREKQINIFLAGNLTNVVVKDGGFRGAILLMTGLKKIDCRHAEGGDVFIDAQAGAALAGVVNRCLTEGLTGLEFCSGIPGSVGGAVWMNAGAYGREMKDVLESVDILDTDGCKKMLKKEEIIFGYRKTYFAPETIVMGARFKLEKGERSGIKARISEILQWRREKHPLEYPSAGSVFKNPPGQPAGKIIEAMGLKGMTAGGAQISSKHANFIVNRDNATATDILTLIELVQSKARQERKIDLETEVLIIGEN